MSASMSAGAPLGILRLKMATGPVSSIKAGAQPLTTAQVATLRPVPAGDGLSPNSARSGRRKIREKYMKGEQCLSACPVNLGACRAIDIISSRGEFRSEFYDHFTNREEIVRHGSDLGVYVLERRAKDAVNKTLIASLAANCDDRMLQCRGEHFELDFNSQYSFANFVYFNLAGHSIPPEFILMGDWINSSCRSGRDIAPVMGGIS
ncbi:hypothetical protein L1787_07655 [Acuticoccus sp. M5D2P5]|uniref:hypothetical protein n=1 Tax=Acuticoccus kalidii TaxID=2910977 RepID=UPI001F46F101|nr:hypothetical protein [Acuticoccus kalidii]MCF3933285.1 hypothetical protein [Acuticoccus kalidii]